MKKYIGLWLLILAVLVGVLAKQHAAIDKKVAFHAAMTSNERVALGLPAIGR